MLVKQLVAAKSAVKSADEGIDAALLYLIEQGDAPEFDPENCDHPEDARAPVPVMGDKEVWICKLCGHVEGGE